MSFKLFFEAILCQLKSSPFIEVTKAVLHGEPSRFTLEDRDFTLSAELLNFYTSMDGCDIVWHCDLNQHPTLEKFAEDDDRIEGRIRINKLIDLYAPNWKLIDFFKDQFDELEAQDLRVFRQFDVNDDYTRVGFLREEKHYDSELYFLLEDADGFSPAPYSFHQYIKNMATYLGWQAWPYHSFMEDEEFDKKVAHYKKQLFSEDITQSL